MAIALWFPLAVPVLVAFAVLVPALSAVRWVTGVLCSVAALAAGVVLVVATRDGAAVSAAGGVLRADALSAYLLSVIGAVGLTATWGGLAGDVTGRQASRTYALLVPLFVAAMSLAVLADNLGVMWVAVEATTIATAFLVGHHQTRQSVEAAWKYVVLGSVGVAIAFLGIALLYAATRAAGHATLSWSVLSAGVPGLDRDLVTVAVALAVLGLATKAGLAPMHSWLPDAHSQAPAPVSGLMSGVLLSAAFYGILRIQAVAVPVLGREPVRTLLVVAGLLSLAVAAALILAQRDYKRMLAYSSIEHMGIMAIGAAVGTPLALAAVLLHVLAHGLIKATLFVAAGRVLAGDGTTRIEALAGLARRRPGLGGVVLVGTAGLLGLPPFGTFFSEVAIVLAAWAAGMEVVAVAMLGLLLVVFAGFARRTATLAFGTRAATADAATGKDEAGWPATAGPRLPLVLALVAAASIAFVTPLGAVLAGAAAVLAGAGAR